MQQKNLLVLISVLYCVTGSPGFAQDQVLERGQRVYQRECVVCHSPGNRSYDALKAMYKDSVYIPVEQRADFDPEEVKKIVRNFGPRMPAFRPTEVTDLELEALARYLSRNRNQ